MAAGTWIYERTTSTGAATPPPFVPPDAPPVTINFAAVREIYDGQFEVSVHWTPHATATADNFHGVGVFLEDPDISEGALAPMNNTVQLNAASQVSGRWAPVRKNDSVVSPAVLIVAGKTAARKIRVYLQAFGKITNATLVRANQPSPTPNVQATIPVAAPAYVSGQEYAWLVTNPTVAVVTDYENPAGPNFHLKFGYTVPNESLPLPPGMKPFAGVLIVYEHDNGLQQDAHFLDKNHPDTWLSSDYNAVSDHFKVWFTSRDVDGRRNTIIKGVTPSVDVNVVYPPAGQPSAPYVTGLALANPRHEWQPDGTLIAKADLTWTAPTSPRYAAVNFYRTGVTPPRLLGQAGALVKGFTLQVIDWPTVAEAWTICAISTDFNGKQSDDPAAPSGAAPTVTWNIGPPAAGGSGLEYTPVGTIDAGTTIDTEQQRNSDGVVMMRHKIGGWHNPTDNSFGGMSIARVHLNDFANATYWDAAKSATSLTTAWEPAPAARDWDFYFVSRDMQERRNSILPGVTPKKTYTFVPIAGDIIPSRLPAGWWDPAEFQWPTYPSGYFQALQFVAKKIFVGSILRVGGGTGVVDASFGGQSNGQIIVYNSANVPRAWMGQHDTTQTPDNLTPHSIFGGWFSELYVGGDSPVNAPLYATQAGVVIVGGFAPAGGRYPYISIRNQFGVEVGRMGAAVGQGQVGEESTIEGAWVREFAYGGLNFADWRMLAKMDVTNPQGASVKMRNVDKFLIQYMANYPSATNPTNSAVDLEFGYGSFVADVASSSYWKFPGITIKDHGSPLGIALIDRGLVIKSWTGYRAAALVAFNGDSFGGNAGYFWGELTLYSSTNSGQINVLLASGQVGGAHPGASYLVMRDEFGNANFTLDPVGDLYLRSRLLRFPSAILIDASGTFVGSGGVNTSGGISTTGVIATTNGFYIGASVVINSSKTFVGDGVNTTGPVVCGGGFQTSGFGGVISNFGAHFGTSASFSGTTTTATLNATSAIQINGVEACNSSGIWKFGLQANADVIGARFGIFGVAFGVTGPTTFTTADGKTVTVRGGIITSIV